MRLAIIYIIVFMLISNGVVWAADNHENTLAEHAAEHLSTGVTDDATTLSDSYTHHVDHQCHMNAHFVALCFSGLFVHQCDIKENYPLIYEKLVTHLASPPIQPPRV